jgi:hypothetical protein
VNASKDDRAEVFNQAVFDSVPNSAMIITQDDSTTFALWYFQFVEKKRIDTSVIAEGLLNYDWYQQSLRVAYPDLEIPEVANLSPYHLIMNNTKRPYCFVYYQEKPEIECFHF